MATAPGAENALTLSLKTRRKTMRHPSTEKLRVSPAMIRHGAVKIDGVNIAYREVPSVIARAGLSVLRVKGGLK
jgi:hypothetical protein